MVAWPHKPFFFNNLTNNIDARSMPSGSVGASLWVRTDPFGHPLAHIHSLGALRIIFLGLPALLFGLGLSILLTTATWTWLTADLALAALR